MTGQLALAFPDPIPLVEAHHRDDLACLSHYRCASVRRAATRRPVQDVELTGALL